MPDEGLMNALAYIMGEPSNSGRPSPTTSDSVEHGSTESDSVERSRLSFRLSTAKRAQLEAIAAHRGMDLSNLVRSIVYEYLSSHKT